MLFLATIFICVAGLAVGWVLSSSSNHGRNAKWRSEREADWGEQMQAKNQALENLRSRKEELENLLEEEKKFRQSEAEQRYREKIEWEIKEEMFESKLRSNKFKWQAIRQLAPWSVTVLICLYHGNLSFESVGAGGIIGLLMALFSSFSGKN